MAQTNNNKKLIGAIAAIGVVAVVGVAAWGLSGDPAANAVLDEMTSSAVIAPEAESSEPVKPKEDAEKNNKDENAVDGIEKPEEENSIDGEEESGNHGENASDADDSWVEEYWYEDESARESSGAGVNSVVIGNSSASGGQDGSGSAKSDKEQTEPANGGNDSSESGNSGNSGEPDNSEKPDDSGKTDNSGSDKPAAQDTQKKVWVEPVYEDVYHEEKGHWETMTRTVTKVICGGTDHNPGDPNYDGPFGGPSPIFDDVSGWKAHQEAFIAEMRKDDPYYQCTGRHRPAKEIQVEESYDEWIVDEEAWTEQVLVSEGYWEYE